MPALLAGNGWAMLGRRGRGADSGGGHGRGHRYGAGEGAAIGRRHDGATVSQ